jgi:hypothetical protein
MPEAARAAITDAQGINHRHLRAEAADTNAAATRGQAEVSLPQPLGLATFGIERRPGTAYPGSCRRLRAGGGEPNAMRLLVPGPR